MSFTLGANESDRRELQKCAEASSKSQPSLCSQNADSKYACVGSIFNFLSEIKLNNVAYIFIREWGDLALWCLSLIA